MRRILLRRSSYAIAGVVFLFAFAIAPEAFASGNIIAPNQYAWSNVAGWINFDPLDSPVIVSNSTVTGYAWSENDGWINLSSSESGVTNNGSGVLGGWAWDQSAGWVSFTGVTIDSSGTFHGEATGSDGYAINFSCSTCDLQTSWHPTTATNSTANNASSPGAISPINPTISTAQSVSVPPIPPPSEAEPGAYPSGPLSTAGRGGGVTSTTSLSHFKPNPGSTNPRAVGRVLDSAAGTPAVTLESELRRIALSAVVLSFFAVLSAVVWFLR